MLSHHHHIARLVRRAAAVALVAVATVPALTSTASAAVNTASWAPHYTFGWGDCNVLLGNIQTATGAARGGADISCGHYRGTINAKVDLYRWNGSRWVLQTTSGWVSVHNTYRLSVGTTQQIRCGGNAYWDDIVTVNVDGSQRTFDLYDGIGYYAQYAPPC
jgi:hypothetical protein